MTSQNQNNPEKSPNCDPQIHSAHSMHVLALFVLGQAPAESALSPIVPIIIGVIAVLIVIYAIVKVLKRPKKPEITQRRETTPEDRIPTKDVLDDRMEVDEPVEITDDMSLADIKRLKAARVTRKEKSVRRETAKDATERAHREREEAEKAAKDAAEAAAEKIKDAATDEADKIADVQAEADTASVAEKPAEDSAPADIAPAEPVSKVDDAETSTEKGEAKPERKITLKKPDFSKLAPKKPASSERDDEGPKKPKLGIKIPKPKITSDENTEEKKLVETEVIEPEVVEPEADVEPEVIEPEADVEPEVIEPEADVEPEAVEPKEEEIEADLAEEPAADVEPEIKADLKPAPEPAPAQKTLAQGLAKTRGGFISRLSGLFSGDQLPEDMVDEVEEILFTADIGPRVAQAILTAVEDGLSGDEMQDPARIWGFIREYCAELLKSHEQPLQIEESKPFVMLVVGVNGAGKTTTIGKLASKLTAQGKKVLLVAGDTYRAGAVDQLAVWADRTHIPIHQGDDEADPSSVLFSGIERGIAEDFDVIICDTSGRLQTNINLMDELAKMARVANKALDGAPHETMLVLDANTGQNAIMQAKKFNEAVEITGISLTKLDGTARGGVILGICDELDAPMRFIGIGESVEDLRAFDADDFVDALFM